MFYTDIPCQGVFTTCRDSVLGVALLPSRRLQTHTHTRTHLSTLPHILLSTQKFKLHSPAEVLILKAFLHTIRHKAAFGQTSDRRVETKAAVSEPEERLTSRKLSINSMPKSMNELSVCACVEGARLSICASSCELVHSSVFGACVHACMHVFRISSPVQLFKHIRCCVNHRITHRSLLHEGGA